MSIVEMVIVVEGMELGDWGVKGWKRVGYKVTGESWCLGTVL